MRTKEEIQKEIEKDKTELSNVVAKFVKITEQITDLRYALDYLASDEMNLNNNIDRNKEKLKILEDRTK